MVQKNVRHEYYIQFYEIWVEDFYTEQRIKKRGILRKVSGTYRKKCRQSTI